MVKVRQHAIAATRYYGKICPANLPELFTPTRSLKSVLHPPLFSEQLGVSVNRKNLGKYFNIYGIVG